MKKIKYKTILFLTVLFTACSLQLTAISFAEGVSLKELISNSRQYDGKLVTYSGEVIGDVMQRGRFAWVNVNDGDSALGIWINADLAKEINFTGSYKSKGDNIEVTGEFHRACLEHGGDMDIHAQGMRKISAGRITKQRVNTDKIILSLILFGILFLVWILTLFKRK